MHTAWKLPIKNNNCTANISCSIVSLNHNITTLNYLLFKGGGKGDVLHGESEKKEASERELLPLDGHALQALSR